MISYKIKRERELKRWSVDSLADRLGVSAEKVLRWENGDDIPELKYVSKMADLFGVTTDYLIKDEITDAIRDNEASANMHPNGEAGKEEACVINEHKPEPRKLVTAEDAEELIRMKNEGGVSVANAVLMCILSPALLISLCCMAEPPANFMSEKLASGIGLVVMFLLIAVAVYKFITFGVKHKRLEYFEREMIELAPGVKEMAIEKSRGFESVFGKNIAVGVVLCIVSVIPLIIAGVMEAPDYVCGILTSVMLLAIAIGVNMIIRVAFRKSSFDMILEEGDYTEENKRIERDFSFISSAYWCVAVAIYLGWSFWTQDWHLTWIVWPVAGVLYGAIRALLRFMVGRKNK